MKPHFAIFLSLALLFCGRAAAESSSAAMISDFRLKHGEGRVTMDATLVRIALQQAKAMAAKDTLDHDVLGSFSSRIAPSKAGRAAENIAYGYGSFEKTLDQWITSPKRLASASPARQAPPLIAPIGPWKSPANMSRRHRRRARDRRPQPDENRLFSLAGPKSLVSASDPPRQRKFDRELKACASHQVPTRR